MDMAKKEAEIVGGLDKVFIGGFSDGSMLTLSIAERLSQHTNETLAGLIALSGPVTALP